MTVNGRQDFDWIMAMTTLVSLLFISALATQTFIGTADVAHVI